MWGLSAATINPHYAAQAADNCPSLRGKTITAHVLRHTTAMRLLHASVDTSVIALWLGHVSVETTQIYLHADLNLKEQALARITPQTSRPGRYPPPDNLLACVNSKNVRSLPPVNAASRVHYPGRWT
jgi:hypothetical protein